MMESYLKAQGFRYKKDYNDMLHKEFTLVNASMSDSERSTFGSLKLDMVESYIIFVKDIDLSILKSDIETILNTATSAGVNVSLGNSVAIENVENGFNITLEFTIRG